eukprot:NODE_27_length_4256_cov_16.558593_g24_i0.p1 GENE.NODE_27_length_4256_cov_16.558593_g24_i0~~NODE_27_length_4256_cov_16.558593_g24_i0.p1  ORF type:complete len:1285 (+),score=301.43 NODE_27_length_4256_cov_16.558593_g24_i0:249-4103(+)
MASSAAERSNPSSSILTCVRFRPAPDSVPKVQCVIDGEELQLIKSDPFLPPHPDRLAECRSYEFSQIWGDTSTQEELHAYFWPSVRTNIFQGWNATVMCYGQTGAGKTYTLCDDGLIPRLAFSVFEHIKNDKSSVYQCSMSFIEIYLDEVFDLLSVTGPRRGSNRGGNPTGGNKMNFFEGEKHVRVPVKSAQDVLRNFDMGNNFRRTASHDLNTNSSRSHSLFYLHLSKRSASSPEDVELWHSKLTVVDLAGSERVAKTHSSGEVFKEAVAINQSLSALSDVVKSLSKKKLAVYRQNILTMYLRDSLMNSFFALICCCSSALSNVDETQCSLAFASMARTVQIQRVRNALQSAGSSGDLSELRRRASCSDLQAQELQDKHREIQALEKELAFTKSTLQELKRSHNQVLENFAKKLEQQCAHIKAQGERVQAAEREAKRVRMLELRWSQRDSATSTELDTLRNQLAEMSQNEQQREAAAAAAVEWSARVCAAESELANERKKLEELSEQRRQLEAELETTRGNADKTVSERDRWRKEALRSGALAAEAQRREEQWQLSLEATTEKAANLEAELETQRAQYSNLEAEFQQLERDHALKQQAHRATCLKVVSQSNGLRVERERLQEQQSSLEEECDRLQSQLRAHVDGATAQARDHAALCKTARAKSKEAEEAGVHLATLRESLARATQSLHAERAAVDEMKAQCRKAEQRTAVIHQDNESLRQCVEKSQETLQKRSTEVEQLRKRELEVLREVASCRRLAEENRSRADAVERERIEMATVWSRKECEYQTQIRNLSQQMRKVDPQIEALRRCLGAAEQEKERIKAESTASRRAWEEEKARLLNEKQAIESNWEKNLQLTEEQEHRIALLNARIAAAAHARLVRRVDKSVQSGSSKKHPCLNKESNALKQTRKQLAKRTNEVRALSSKWRDQQDASQAEMNRRSHLEKELELEKAMAKIRSQTFARELVGWKRRLSQLATERAELQGKMRVGSEKQQHLKSEINEAKSGVDELKHHLRSCLKDREAMERALVSEESRNVHLERELKKNEVRVLQVLSNRAVEVKKLQEAASSMKKENSDLEKKMVAVQREKLWLQTLLNRAMRSSGPLSPNVVPPPSVLKRALDEAFHKENTMARIVRDQQVEIGRLRKEDGQKVQKRKKKNRSGGAGSGSGTTLLHRTPISSRKTRGTRQASSVKRQSVRGPRPRPRRSTRHTRRGAAAKELRNSRSPQLRLLSDCVAHSSSSPPKSPKPYPKPQPATPTPTHADSCCPSPLLAVGKSCVCGLSAF